MPDVTKDELIEIIYKSVPYSDQIHSLDTTIEGCIRFRWRQQHFRVSLTLETVTIERSMFVGDDISLILQASLNRTFVQLLDNKTKVAQ